MAEWKTLRQETMEAGGNNFIEISLKQPPEGEHVFIGISKGWYTDEGQKRYKTNILFTKDKREELIKLLNEIDKEG